MTVCRDGVVGRIVSDERVPIFWIGRGVASVFDVECIHYEFLFVFAGSSQNVRGHRSTHDSPSMRLILDGGMSIACLAFGGCGFRLDVNTGVGGSYATGYA